MKKQNRKKGRADNTAPSLLGVIFFDIFMRHWFITLLVFLLVISAMQKARTSHDARRATAKLQKLKNDNQELQIEWQSLNLEITSLTESDRLSQLAKEKLNMKKVKLNNEKIISL